MRAIIFPCVLAFGLVGCVSTAPEQVYDLGELKAHLSAVGPVEIERPQPERVVLRVDVPTDPVLGEILTRPAEISGITEADTDRVWVLRADPALVEVVPDLAEKGSPPPSPLLDTLGFVVATVGAVAVLAGLAWLGDQIEPGCISRCY